MAIATHKDRLVRVNIARMIDNAAREGRPMNDRQARDLLLSWGFRHFGQFWRCEEQHLSKLKPDEIERVDPAERPELAKLEEESRKNG